MSGTRALPLGTSGAERMPGNRADVSAGVIESFNATDTSGSPAQPDSELTAALRTPRCGSRLAAVNAAMATPPAAVTSARSAPLRTAKPALPATAPPRDRSVPGTRVRRGGASTGTDDGSLMVPRALRNRNPHLAARIVRRAGDQFG